MVTKRRRPTRPRSAKEIPFDPALRPEDTREAEKTIKHFIQPDLDHPRFVLSIGKCPRCKHDTENRRPLMIVGPEGVDAAEILDEIDRRDPDILDAKLRAGEVEFDMRCKCGVDHPSHPDKDLSCGSRFRVRVRWP